MDARAATFRRAGRLGALAVMLPGLLGSAAGDLSAQDAPIETGARVRVTTSAGAEPIVGWIDAIDPDGVRLVREKNHGPIALARSEILRMERSRVRRSLDDQAVPGMIAGGVLGLVVGITQTEELHCDPGSWLCIDYPDKALGGLGGAVIGMIAGSVISAVIVPGESWEDASVPAVTVETVTDGGGVALGLRIPLGSGRRP